MKKIGIVIPAYNAEKYISYCLDSILNQSNKNAQIIIVDDCSEDDTLTIINSYKLKFEKLGFEYNVISLDKNQGQAACFNYAFNILNSELFMWLDSDDFLYENCFQEKINFMDKNSNVDLCICRGGLYNWPDLNFKVSDLYVKDSTCDYFYNILTRKDVLWAPGSICVRTNFILSRLRHRKIYSSREGQNIQLLLPILYNSNYSFINKELYGVVAHQDSHSRKKRNSKQIIYREKGILLIYKKTIGRLDASRKDKIKFNKIVKKNIYLSIFNYCVSKKMFIRSFYYYFHLNKNDKINFLKVVFGRIL